MYGSEPVQCEKIGLMLADIAALDNTTDKQENPARKEFSDLIRQYIHRDFSLSHMIDNGIAFHYGNLPSFVRKGIQELLSSSDLSFVVCTSTLLQGINLPAKNVFVMKPTKGRSDGIGVPISSTEFWNLVGRAGRLTKDFEGNIFLINIDQWQENPFSGPKRQTIYPSFRAHLCDRTSELLDFISNKDHGSGVQQNAGFENSFMKLFNDYRSGKLSKTLEQHQNFISSEMSVQITALMNEISSGIDVPSEITESNPNISVYRQQEMFNYILSKMESDGPDVLIPPHPLQGSRDVYTMYLRLFKRIHNCFEKKATSDKSHTYFASLALSWMRGKSYAELLNKRIQQKQKTLKRGHPDVNTEARALFREVENDLRFRYVKYTRCYIELLKHALNEKGLNALIDRIPPIYLFLELGASSMTMMSLIGLGISRTGAAIVSDFAPKSDMKREDAVKWLKATNLNVMKLPNLLRNELDAIVNQ